MLDRFKGAQLLTPASEVQKHAGQTNIPIQEPRQVNPAALKSTRSPGALIPYNIYSLKRIQLDSEGRLSGARTLLDGTKSEVEAQNKRVEGKFQIIYRNDLVIPTDPTERPDTSCEARARYRCDLREFYDDWSKIENDRRKHLDIAHQLSEMLDRGLFRCAPENVFKVVVTLKVEHLLRGTTKQKIQEAFDGGKESERQMIEELPQILGPMTANLIQIWNAQISPQEFQYFPEPLQKQMVALNEQHGQKKPILFGLELLEFY